MEESNLKEVPERIKRIHLSKNLSIHSTRSRHWRKMASGQDSHVTRPLEDLEVSQLSKGKQGQGLSLQEKIQLKLRAG